MAEYNTFQSIIKEQGGLDIGGFADSITTSKRTLDSVAERNRGIFSKPELEEDTSGGFLDGMITWFAENGHSISKDIDSTTIKDDTLKEYQNLKVRDDSFDVMSFTPQGLVLKIEEPDADQEKMDAKYIRINTNPPTADEVQPPDGKDPFHPSSFTQKHLEKVEAGGYNTLFGNAEKTSKEFKDVKITDMSIGELVEFTKPSGPYGKWVKPRLPEDTEAYQRGLTSTPLGKYQIVGTTLRKLVKDYGWSLEDKFTKKVQDRMFLQLAYEALDNKESMGEKVKSMRKVWEGLREGKGSTEQDVIKIIKEIESTRLSRSPFPRRKPAGIMERPPL